MSVTKAELVRINEKLQETIRVLLRERQTLQAETEQLRRELTCSAEQIKRLTVRYQKLSDYTRQLHDWLTGLQELSTNEKI